MKKYIISWDAGQGSSHYIIEAKNKAEATAEARKRLDKEVKSLCSHSSEVYTKERALEIRFDEGDSDE